MRYELSDPEWGIIGRCMEALAISHAAAVQMIDTPIVHVHQRRACIAGNNSKRGVPREAD